MSVKAEVFCKLQEADWKTIGTQLTAYATWKAKKFTWRTGGKKDLATGLQAVDIAQTAIGKVINGERGWDPQRGDLLPYLKGVVDSLMSHMATGADNKLQTRIAEDEAEKQLLDRAQFQAAQHDDFELLSSHQKTLVTNSDGKSERVAELFAAVDGEADLIAVLDVVMDSGETKPATIAAELGIEVTEVYNRLKRLRRAAWEIKQPPKV